MLRGACGQQGCLPDHFPDAHINPAMVVVRLAVGNESRYSPSISVGPFVVDRNPFAIPSLWRVFMILSGSEIQARLGTDIMIDPFRESQLNPNSYNLRLHNELLVYEEIVLDMRRPSRHRRIEIPPDGLELNPGQLYLARTVERTETHNLVPMLEGRSSVGRLGLFVHVTAGFGDVGFCGYWTLEMYAVQPVRIYPGVEICQIFYHTIKGAIREYDKGKYQNNHDIQPSLLYTEMQSKEDRQRRLWSEQ